MYYGSYTFLIKLSKLYLIELHMYTQQKNYHFLIEADEKLSLTTFVIIKFFEFIKMFITFNVR